MDMDIAVCPECDMRPVSSHSEDFLCVRCRAVREGRDPNDLGKIYCVRVQQYDEKASPPDRIVEIACVGEVVFVDVFEYEEKSRTQEARNRGTVGINAEPLVRALIAIGVPVEWKGEKTF